MPFPPQEIDTSTWGVKDWRQAFYWNAGFLVIWIAFWTYIAVDLWKAPQWFAIVWISVIGGGMTIKQVVDLIKLHAWLRRQACEDDNGD